MKTIWKYPLNLGFNGQRIRFRKGAKILKADMQGDAICIWALVDDAEKEEWREITIYGTGHRIPDELVDRLSFIDTVMDGAYVWHVFELQNISNQSESKQT